jgi:hypothetical protein
MTRYRPLEPPVSTWRDLAKLSTEENKTGGVLAEKGYEFSHGPRSAIIKPPAFFALVNTVVAVPVDELRLGDDNPRRRTLVETQQL